MERFETWFCIADVPIRFITPTPLTVEPAFEGYLSAPCDGAVTCVFEQTDTLPNKFLDSTEVFCDNMHRIFWSERGTQQYYYIPYRGALPPQQRKPDLYQLMDDNPCREMRLYFRPEAADYFATASGCFNAAKIERLLIHGQRLVLHASFIEWQGKAIAFTANSGVGKSTQADLWEKYADAETINGDRMAFGLRNGVMTGFGLPVAGSSGIFTNKAVPIRAIVLLGRAPQSSISRAASSGAIRDLLQQVTVNRWDQRFMTSVFHILSQLLGLVPAYRLLATPDEDAVNCLKLALTEE